MSLQLKPPEEKTKSSSLPPSLPPSLTPSFSLLPDEITINYLARIPRSYYPTLSIVCKSFRLLLSSTEIFRERSRLGTTEQCLYACITDNEHQFSQWFTDNRIPPNSSVIKKTIRPLLVSITSSNFPSLANATTVAVGSEIYVMGGPFNKAPSSAVQILDCRSHTWRDAPSMNVARKNARPCVHDGKIYVFGGCQRLEDDEPWGELISSPACSRCLCLNELYPSWRKEKVAEAKGEQQA
ncbi:hypothetical protein AALP_AA7G023100 [Arabis alpina]|uniref:F-box domain-containing protein n=1 Tax=Arabis alpina TaxID=50452 RepID=A0A087GFG8_ARAAL|nr:hypothetical protein AALP_AA7G023100 [Arabis alpina]